MLQWTFPSGERADIKTYKLQTGHGVLGIGIPKDKWNASIPLLLTLSLDVSTISPDVEINIPLTLNRKISGVFVKHEKDIWLCSRGMFTAYRGKIKRELTFLHFDKWLLEINDADKTTSVIPVAALTSPDIANQIASFVLSVNNLKEKYKKHIDGCDSLITYDWKNGSEYEGKKTKSSTESKAEYEYLHGPICNELQHQLAQACSEK